ncbi:hypothetical protein FM105_03710 [Brevibacterium yomogidense]|uniref:Uncharacterized protein n=1 Tax=Brevibacterium yomogidense TaxID=946573 RepID=A0A1X6X3P2_9MICO|nr:hypothetical protein FM105_03710 [Brevibacterium yomogidense]
MHPLGSVELCEESGIHAPTLPRRRPATAVRTVASPQSAPSRHRGAHGHRSPAPMGRWST